MLGRIIRRLVRLWRRPRGLNYCGYYLDAATNTTYWRATPDDEWCIVASFDPAGRREQ